MTVPYKPGDTAVVVAGPVDHFTGARFSRRTWQALLVSDGDKSSALKCAHYMHPSEAAALKCGAKTWPEARTT